MGGARFLAQATTRLEAADGVHGTGVGAHDPPLAVEDDNGLGAVRSHGPGPIFVHHSFTIRLPFAYPVALDGTR